MTKELIEANYNGTTVFFSEKGWLNATEAASKYGKVPAEWLRLPETERYIEALCEFLNTGKSHIIKTRRGKNGGTWFCPDLVVPFARWLDVRFAIFCDQHVKKLLSGNHPHFDWKKIRHEASSSFKVMNEALRLVREEQGKVSESHHYSNEARLINWALSGGFGKLDRNTLSSPDLDLLAKLEVKNSVLISRGLAYRDRKKMLEQYAIDLRSVNQPLIAQV